MPVAFRLYAITALALGMQQVTYQDVPSETSLLNYFARFINEGSRM